jgi:amino acid transporter
LVNTWKHLKDIIIGLPLPTKEFASQQLNKVQALAAFSPDALSSIAYANQEIFLGLVVAGAAGLSMSFNVGLIIVVILIILTMSYYQTIQGYPSGGGSWIVARENLGKYPGLIAAAALLIDYLLVAAVSLTAGVEAIASAFPVLWPERVPIALLILVIIALLNMRGSREAGNAMSIPVYLFIFTYVPMLVYGAIRAISEGPGNLAEVAPAPIQPLTLVLLLHAFSSGCTALTGIESVSNGVPAFKDPKSQNAGKTLIAMSILMAALFLGSIGLTQYFAVIPGVEETILSALAHRIIGDGAPYMLIQVSTLLILAVAANTSFSGFPRVVALLAQDSYLPRQFSNLGDRLVFTNGMILLAAATAALIIIFGGNTHSLIPLFAVGAFLAFTFSQSGMIFHWRRVRGSMWQIKALINGAGALMTASALIVIGINKFIDGAWLTFLLIPLIVLVFRRIRQHYTDFDMQMSSSSIKPNTKNVMILQHTVIPVAHINQGTVAAVAFARRVSRDVIGIHVELTEGTGKELINEWKRLWPNLPLNLLNSPFRSITEPILTFLEDLSKKHHGESIAVVLPTYVPAKWWQSLLHTHTTSRIREAIIDACRESGTEITIIEVPYLLKR